MSTLDLSNPDCHVCGRHLERDLNAEEEWCSNDRCQLFLHHFNISYDTWAGIPHRKPPVQKEKKGRQALLNKASLE